MFVLSLQEQLGLNYYLYEILFMLCTCQYFLAIFDGVVWFMVFNATFNNISVISRHSVLLVEETGIPGENHRPVASHLQTLSHIVSSTPRNEQGLNSQLEW